MRVLGLVVLAGMMLDCGGKAAETAASDTPALGGTGGTDTGSGGSTAGGALVDAGNPSSISTLVACAPQIGGATPRAICATDYTPGLACDPSTFAICSTPGDEAEIWCGRPATCVDVTLSAVDGGSENPCVGACPALNQSCSWVVNTMGGGVTSYQCCHDYESGLPDEGRLLWKLGPSCMNGLK